MDRSSLVRGFTAHQAGSIHLNAFRHILAPRRSGENREQLVVNLDHREFFYGLGSRWKGVGLFSKVITLLIVIIQNIDKKTMIVCPLYNVGKVLLVFQNMSWIGAKHA